MREKKLSLNKFVQSNAWHTTKDLNLEKYKRSDTVFILGSGASINDIDTQQWAHIGQHDTIGFNNWTLHPFIPTYYFFEPTSRKNAFQIKMNDQIYHNLKSRMTDYQHTAVIFHYLERYYFDQEVTSYFSEKENLFFQAPVNLPGKTIDELHLAYKTAFALGYFDDISQSVYRRGSVAKIIHFAIAAGYKNIVLLGVDLNTSPYFFDTNNYELPKGCTELEFTKVNDGSKLHDTVNPELGLTTMLDVIEVIKDKIAKPKGIKLYNGSTSSKLTSILKFYWPQVQ